MVSLRYFRKAKIEWSLEPSYEKWIFEDEGAVFIWRIESERINSSKQ